MNRQTFTADNSGFDIDSLVENHDIGILAHGERTFTIVDLHNPCGRQRHHLHRIRKLHPGQ